MHIYFLLFLYLVLFFFTEWNCSLVISSLYVLYCTSQTYVLYIAEMTITFTLPLISQPSLSRRTYRCSTIVHLASRLSEIQTFDFSGAVLHKPERLLFCDSFVKPGKSVRLVAPVEVNNKRCVAIVDLIVVFEWLGWAVILSQGQRPTCSVYTQVKGKFCGISIISVTSMLERYTQLVWSLALC